MSFDTTQPQPTQNISSGQATILSNFQYLGSTTGNTNPTGYYKLPNGLIVNWGRIDITTVGNKTQSYAQAYTTIVYNLQFSLGYVSAGDVRDIPLVCCIDTNANIPLSLTTAKFRCSDAPSGGNTLYLWWVAIGK